MSIQYNDPVFARQLGPGEKIVKGVSGKTTTYKTLVAGNNITITNNLTYLEISGEGAGAGGGTAGPGTQYEMAYYDPDNFIIGNSNITTDASDNLNITNGNIYLTNGSSSSPSYSFTSDPNTGMYRVGADTLGFSVQSTQAVTIAGASPPVTMIRGLNVGTTTNVGGIQRLCNDSANSWQDGHMGNSTQLVFTPIDFMVANPTMSRAAGALTTSYINLVGSGLGWNVSPGGRYGEPVIGTATANDAIVAIKLIPKGFIIKDEFRMIILSNVNLAGNIISVAYRRVEDLTGITSPGNVFVDNAYTFNTQVNLTGITGPSGGSVVGDGLGFLIIYIQPSQQLDSANGIRGAIVGMARY